MNVTIVLRHVDDTKVNAEQLEVILRLITAYAQIVGDVRKATIAIAALIDSKD